MLRLEIRDDARQAAILAAELTQPVFERMGWTWGRSDVSPTKTEIEESVLELFETLEKFEESESVSSGRLQVSRDNDGRYEVHLELAGFYEGE